MLQNKKLADKKLTIWRKYTVFDFVIFFAIIALAIVLSGFTNKFNWKFKIAIFITFILSTFWILLYSKKHNCRFYVLGFRAFKYLVGVRKYDIKSKNSTSFLIPYSEIINDEIVINRKNNFGIFNHFSVVKIKGFNVFVNSEQDREAEFLRFTNLLNSVDDKITIIKTSAPMDLTSNINEIDKNLNTSFIQNNNLAKEYCLLNKQELETLNEKDSIDNYYLVIYGNSIEDLMAKRTRIILQLTNTKFNPQLVKGIDLLNVLNLIFRVQLNDKNLSNIERPASLLAPKNVEFFKKYMVADNKYISFQSINDFNNIELQDAWTYKLFSSNSTVIWNLSAFDDDLKEKILNKASSMVEINNNSKSRFKTVKSKVEMEAIENLIYLANTKNMNIFNSNFIFVNQGNNLDEINALETQNQLNASEISANINPLLFKQKQAYASACLINGDNIGDDLEMVSENISRGWGFVNSELNDKTPLLFGFDMTTDSPLFLDIKTKNSQRVYSNMLITGTPGSGKSTLMKKMVLHYLIYGTEIIILDPQREYTKFAKLFDGEVFEMGTGINTLINPLQLDLQFNEQMEIKNQNKIIISSNIRKVQKFLKIMCNFNDIEVRFIGKSLSELYNKWGFYDENINFLEFQNTDYPTINDYLTFLETYEFDNTNDKEIYLQSQKFVLATIKSEFTNNSPYEALYNGYTNINFSSKFNIIDTYNLSTKDDSPASKAGLFLILSFIQNRISNNYFSNPEGKNWIMLVIDEAHKFIDPINPIALDFVWDTAKTIRKYRGMLVLGTQNFMDFNQNQLVQTKSAGILENMQYSITLRSNYQDIEALKTLFENRMPLTEQELQFLSSAPIGGGILSIDNTTRFQFESYYNELERKLLFNNGDLKAIANN